MCKCILSMIRDILIALVTGIISGYIANYFYKKENVRLEKERIYKNDVQMYSHYISMIRLKLNSKIKSNDDNDILEIIENRPLTYSFDKTLKEEGKKITDDIYEILDGLKEKILKNKKVEYSKTISDLYKKQLKLIEKANKFYI